MSTALNDARIHSFPHVWCNPVKSFFSDRKLFTGRHIVDLFRTGESGNLSLNLFWKLSKNEVPRSVRKWTLFALVKKTSLHLDCLKTVDRLARAGYSMTWPACVLVQSLEVCTGRNFKIHLDAARGRFCPTPNCVFKYVTRIQTKRNFLLFELDWNSMYALSALIIVLITYVCFHAYMPVIRKWIIWQRFKNIWG
jgi:hypothetical protein